MGLWPTTLCCMLAALAQTTHALHTHTHMTSPAEKHSWEDELCTGSTLSLTWAAGLPLGQQTVEQADALPARFSWCAACSFLEVSSANPSLTQVLAISKLSTQRQRSSQVFTTSATRP